MNTRTLAAVALAVATVTAGCGFLLGSEALSFSADPATVSDGALSETGYQETNVTSANVTRNFTVADQTREVRVVNHLAQYERQVELGVLEEPQQAAVVTVFASPQVEVAGQTLNPIGNMDERDLLQRFDSGYQGISVGQQVGNATVRSLGASRSVPKFEGTATFGEAELDVYVHAATFKHGDDYLAVVAIYPQQVPGEEERVLRMLEGLEHASGE